jgi:hypothetical protein
MPTAELEALSKRFGPSASKIDSESEFSLFIPPRDPNSFPYELKTLNVKCSVPDDYPNSILKVQVLNDLPESLRQSMKTRIEERAVAAYKGKEMIAGLFTFIQNNLEKLMIDTTINRAFQLKNRGVEVFAFANNESKAEESPNLSSAVAAKSLDAVSMPRREKNSGITVSINLSFFVNFGF